MLKWLKYILGLAILAFLIWYLVGHWQDVKELLRLNFTELAIIYLASFIGTLNNAVVVTTILKPMGTKTLFGDMIILQNAGVLLNYLPMKFGTLFMANYLKRHYGLKYAHFGTFSIFLTLLINFAACFSGAIIMTFVYGLDNIQKQILAAVFLASSIASVFVIFVPLPVPAGSSRASAVMRDFILSRSAVRKDMKSLSKAAIFLFFNFVMMSVRLAVIYYSMDIKIHPAGFLVLGALGYIVLFINFTPGALGIREAVLGAGAVILGIPLEVGIAAALIDRAITLSWAFAVGGICAGWLWHKTPADFKKTTIE
ncbi:MAG: lysylphosphatidylglycerol synthase transmembrane domain-containing protein [Phycisphaerae bacterium]|nr:lysylphosphatidylglycerol synthase transmembrane domain-containing protein [Phycisphaerae bacterium]